MSVDGAVTCKVIVPRYENSLLAGLLGSGLQVCHADALAGTRWPRVPAAAHLPTLERCHRLISPALIIMYACAAT